MKFRYLTDQDADRALHVWVRGPELPEEVEAEDLLTAEDHRDLTLDHISRTCEFVVQLQILKLG